MKASGFTLALSTACTVLLIGGMIRASQSPPTPQLRLASAGRPTLGDPRVGVEVAVFLDPGTPASAALRAGPLTALQAEFVPTGEAHFVYFQAPLSGEVAVRAAVAAECAHMQGPGAYFRFGAALGSAPAPADLDRAAGAAGLDLARWRACLTAAPASAQVQADLAQYRPSHLDHAPGVFVDGVSVAPTAGALRRAILRASGTEQAGTR